VVLAAVAQDGRALKYASAELQGDREVVLASVTQNHDALCFALSEMKSDREVGLARSHRMELSCGTRHQSCREIGR